MPTDEIRAARAALAALSDEDRRSLVSEFGLKTPIGWRGILADGKLPLTVAGWILASVATWLYTRDQTLTPAQKMDYFNNWLLASSAVWSALMVAMGYQKGKANEGTVPEGRMAIPNYTVVQPVVVSPSPVPLPAPNVTLPGTPTATVTATTIIPS